MNIFTVISPLVLVALVGFISAKSKWLTKDQIDAISKFTFYISIPAFLFYQMSKANFSDQISPQLFAAFYLPVLCCYLIAALVNHFFHRNHKKNNAASAVFALGSSYSNTVIVGLPVLLMSLGEQVVGIVFLIVTFHSAMLFGLTSAFASISNSTGHLSNTLTNTSIDVSTNVFAKGNNKKSNFDWRSFLKQTFNNPLIISILSGFLFNIFSIAIPEVLQESLTLIGKPAITLALFVLGASLAFYQVKHEFSFILFASFSKLLLLPFLVYFSAKTLFDLDQLVTTVLVILSACPTGVNAYLIAKMQGKHQATVAGSVVVSTLVSIITIPLWLIWLS